MTRRILWAALALQALAILLMRQPWITSDSLTYLGIAARIEERWTDLGDTFFVPDAVRPPGFPWLLWLFRHVLGWSDAMIVALQMTLYLVSVYLVARVARRYIDERLFLLLCLLFPYAAFYSAVLMTEAWAIAACALVFFLLHERTDLRGGLLVGVVAALAALLRSNLIVLPALAAALVLVPAVLRSTRTHRIRVAAAISISAFVVLLPFTIRNGLGYGKWLPLQPAGALGASLFQGTWQRAVGEADRYQFFQHRVITESVRSTGYAAENFRLADQLGVPRFTPLAIEELPEEKRIRADSLLRAAAVERIKERPMAYAGHVALNVFDLGNPRSYPSQTPRAVELVMRVICALIWFTGLLALLLTRGQARRALVISTALIGGLLFVQIWLHTEARYAAPVLLLITLNASVVLSDFISLLADRRGIRLAACA